MMRGHFVTYAARVWQVTGMWGHGPHVTTNLIDPTHAAGTLQVIGHDAHQTLRLTPACDVCQAPAGFAPCGSDLWGGAHRPPPPARPVTWTYQPAEPFTDHCTCREPFCGYCADPTVSDRRFVERAGSRW